MSKFYANKTQVFWACRSLILIKENRIILDALIDTDEGFVDTTLRLKNRKGYL